LAALELFERAITQKDIATGKVKPGSNFITRGTPKSTFREGNSTIQLTVLPLNSTYPPPTPASSMLKVRSIGFENGGKKVRTARKGSRRGGRRSRH